VFARHGFNELVSFIAGWAVLLDDLLLIAVTALSATNYLQAFWEPLGSGAWEAALTVGIIGYVTLRNLRGFGSDRGKWMTRIVAADVVLLLILVIGGFATFWDPDVLTSDINLGESPTWGGLVFALGAGTIVFAGLESATSLAGETDTGGRTLRRLVSSMTGLLATVYVGTSIVAVTALPFENGESDLASIHRDAPILGITRAFGGTFGEVLTYAFALVAAITLIAASNSAMLGLSRLSYSLSRNRQIPSGLGRLHPTRATPFVAITLSALIAIALALPQDIELLVGLYAFGALIGITIAHASIISLRYREPLATPAYEVPWSVRFRGGRLPVPAVVGLVVSTLAWVSVVITHTGSRAVGFGWMLFGVALYVGYRLSQGKPLLKRVQVPEGALKREVSTLQYGSILVPLTGTAIDDDMMQTAGRFAADQYDSRDPDAEPTTIEALFVMEVPMALPIDARLPDEQLALARSALLRAKAVGEEYQGVSVATAKVRGRRAGAVIVEEARRRGVEAIVMAAEEPSRIRGGAVLGGLSGARDNFVGEVTKYVVAKAACQVLLTAPATDPESAVVTETEAGLRQPPD
jgi:APA family basic amino acid/polyamine antiporter